MSHFWTLTLPAPLNALGELNLNTMLMVWLAMGVLLGLAWMLTRKLSVVPTGRMQLLAEGVYDLCRSITLSTAGPRGDSFLFFVGSIFLFILTCNLMGQLPLRLFHLPHGELMAATGDINVTAALALGTLLMYFLVGLKQKGLGYFKHYFSPHWAFFPLNLIEDLTRPGSLMIRLYFNILVGEILSGIALSVTPFVLPAVVIVLELFVAVVQAYIFAILSSVYISILSEEHH